MFDKAQVVVEFKCPFCGANAAVVKPDGVVHGLPMCKVFDELEPLAFLRAVNNANRSKN